MIETGHGWQNSLKGEDWMGNLTFSPNSHNELTNQKNADKLLEMNHLLSQYGLRLTPETALALIKARNQTLHDYGRLEFGTGILEQLALAFCDSSYLNEESYTDNLMSFLELFYRTKSESMERMPDELVIERMKEAFNGSCEGSFKRLEIVMDAIAYNIRVYGSETAPETKEASDNLSHVNTDEDDLTGYESQEDENWRSVKF